MPISYISTDQSTTIANAYYNKLQYYRCCCFGRCNIRVCACAKVAAVISAVLYVISVAASVVFNGWYTIIPILLGIFIYGTLYVGVFRGRYHLLLPYLIFEVISTVGVFLLIIILSVELSSIVQFRSRLRWEMNDYDEHGGYRGYDPGRDVLSWNITLLSLLICAAVCSAIIKLWLFSVILALFNFLRYKKRYDSFAHAQYVNGGVSIIVNTSEMTDASAQYITNIIGTTPAAADNTTTPSAPPVEANTSSRTNGADNPPSYYEAIRRS